MEKQFKQICHCEKCGSEAEMMVTCELVPEDVPEQELEKKAKVSKEKTSDSVQGQAVCSHCGSEADMWVDF
ncbi:MAG: hypothetical protein ACQETG_03395 [Thermodesulfobacteriota bacterium]